MAQRNPMNERYQGDGPQGKTRKSAAKLKPKTEAAASVHIEKKPATRQERKAARKKRDAQMAAKEAERKRKAVEREREARVAAGEVAEKPEKASMGGKLMKFLGFSQPAGQAAPAASAQMQKPGVPDTPQYRRYKRIYRIMIGIGVVAIAISLVGTFVVPDLLEGTGMMVLMGIAYVFVIGAIVLDYAKIRKMQKEHQAKTSGSSGRQSPKQFKHQQQKAEAAALLEESKKAQRELRRANSKLPFLRKAPTANSAVEGTSHVAESSALQSSEEAAASKVEETNSEINNRVNE